MNGAPRKTAPQPTKIDPSVKPAQTVVDKSVSVQQLQPLQPPVPTKSTETVAVKSAPHDLVTPMKPAQTVVDEPVFLQQYKPLQPLVPAKPTQAVAVKASPVAHVAETKPAPSTSVVATTPLQIGPPAIAPAKSKPSDLLQDLLAAVPALGGALGVGQPLHVGHALDDPTDGDDDSDYEMSDDPITLVEFVFSVFPDM